MMMKNRPRMKTTNERIESHIFEYSFSIRGWSIASQCLELSWEVAAPPGCGKNLSAFLTSVVEYHKM